MTNQSNSPQLDNDDLKQIVADDLEEMDLKWQMAMLTVRARRFLQRTGRNLGANGPTSMGFDMSKVECYNCHRKGRFVRECRSPKDTRRNGAAEEESTNYALMAFTSSCSSSSDNELRDNALVVLRQNLEKAEQEREDLKLKLEKFQTSSKILSQLLASQTNDKTRLGYNTQVFTSSMFDCDEMFTYETDESFPASPICDRYQSGDGYHAVPPPYTGTFMPPKPDLVFHDSPNVNENVYTAFQDDYEAEIQQNSPSFVQPSEQVKTPRSSVKTVKTSIPAANHKTSIPKPKSNGNNRNRKACFVLLTKSKLVLITAAKPVTAIVPKPHVTRLRQAKIVVTKPYSPPRRTINRSSSPKTWKPKCPILDHISHNTSASMTLKRFDTRMHLGDPRNMSYLFDFEELNGGYVSFGGNPKGGKISGKGKIRTGKLDFDDVYFVKELKFYLFSVSQMCDKKNSVLFTDTECIVLSPEFKLLDENQVLLRVPRENNMYNVDLKNIVPFGDLTCLYAKATLDESNLWHRRLGHINFKTMNKLVKANLIRGLPTKVFENNQTCVACKKGKQHRASCKTKPVSSVSQPLKSLHMDLFRPTFVKSLNKKSYCLVVTDDYSRFTWVFFLATKDETSPILKTFITGIENQLSLKREFSVPRTPQQNGIAERKNKTLIEAARTMLADSLLPIPFWVEAVNTACYVQNRVLVTKPQNKTPYELLLGRTPSIGFMRPFGYHVTIFNTLDPLGKFDGKVDEGFLVGYSVSSKSFRVFNSRTRIVQETLHINFLENKPNVAEKAGDDNVQQYVLFYIWSFGFTNPQNTDDKTAFKGEKPEFEGRKPESEVHVSPSSSAQIKKHDDKTKREAKGKSPVESSTGYRIRVQSLKISLITTLMSAAGPSNTVVSPTHGKSSYVDTSQYPDDPNMPALEDITYSDDEEDVGAEADFTNLETTITVSHIPTTKVHKDHPVTQIIGDLSSATQTRSMTRVAKDQGGLSQINNDDFHTCMFACFLSQEEPKRVHQALKDPSWIEAMQEELLQFKMQQVWVLVHLPNGKRAIGHTQEEGIDYEEVFAPVVRIEAIRMFLAYVSFMGFMVYQMDVKSAFLYGTIEEEVYVCQPLGFEDPDYPDNVYKVVKALYGLHQAPRAAQVGDLSSHPIKYSSPALTQKVFANIRMVGKGFSGVDTPLFEGMIVAQQVDDIADEGVASVAVDDVPERIIADIDADEDVTLKDVAAVVKDVDDVNKDTEIEESADVQGRQAESQAQIYQIDLEHADKVLSMHDDEIEPAELQEVVEVVTTAKLMTKVVTAASAIITAATTLVTAATITAAPNAARRRKRVQAQIEQDEAYARELEAELNKNINWDDVIDQVQRKEKEDNAMMRNMAGFKMDYFKGMSYDDIRPIFEKYFNSNVDFLEKTKEQMEEEDGRALKRASESQAEKAAKKQKLDKEVVELKKHLQIMPNDEDDVYTEATPLARKVPVVDYEIYTENNKPYYKIIRADGSPQLFLSFLSILRNFDREDLRCYRNWLKKDLHFLSPRTS
uniref:Putative ribonuclease H-like domain-containing protein n=1 Tax=Tanacetum cinerariifolium TaxID=118510 RepID=A0A6L2L2S1_TANCI|nr:putative ribonuclease H-like domain-containing protein [Tanacetum cinerariifolium]